MIVAHTRADLLGALHSLDAPLALVPTMGSLHAGHVALIEAARSAELPVLVTIFVNPLQFGVNEDLASYPRSLDADLAMCRELGADSVWAPGVADVYPSGDAAVRIDPGPLGAVLEGRSRPTHFAGVLTVVAKFFALIRPSVAFFGEKDYQQLTLIRRMVGDLDLGVGIAGVPTVRDPDGLALSSRNAYLSAADREQALALSRALRAGRDAAAGGADAVVAAARDVLAGAPGVRPDYLELRSPDLREVSGPGPARLLVAARVGGTRLIDNLEVAL